ncbi:HD domain-containing protein [Acidaminobacter hydrogenoformans]|uniref:HDIG domain-containing protein n=1 Tax=Acidaminobacter hydrogenoformans DSM 2784 TaxID=1120920 RepID=A0A1G5RXB5_9FIRM|nr:HD domain-containing protein [Acidaminobacter hydrogenoformans]SCZ78683.1 HDIG domain-containing protein [Acidaminobacter hydrogenoformans DSM 2784]
MKDRIKELIPEIDWIIEDELKSKVVATYLDALNMGHWEPDDMDKIPFTLLIQNCPFSYLDHVRGVTRVAKKAMEEFNAIYASKDSKYTLNHDLLIAGALLHDIGKLVEYEKDESGKTVKSKMGKDLRHPFSGTVLALRNGCSSEIGHIIANHAAEGDGTLRGPEAVMVNKADFINFEIVKSFLGMK